MTIRRRAGLRLAARYRWLWRCRPAAAAVLHLLAGELAAALLIGAALRWLGVTWSR